MSVVNPRIQSFLYKGFSHLPTSLRHVIIITWAHVQDPKPEISSTSNQEVGQPEMLVGGWLPALILANAWGILSVAYADISSRFTTTSTSTFFWLGLIFIFVPATVRIISPEASRSERIILLCVIGISLYIVRVIYSPLYFSGYDEYLHWRTVDDITRSRHLFSENSLLPVSPVYPGLEIVTNELSTLSGLSTFTSGIVVIGIARLLMVLSIFLLNEQILKSARMAGIGTLIYIANPHFLFFDSQFGYESLALPLATFMIFVMAYRESQQNDRHWLIVAAWIVLAGVVVTHHLTDFTFVGILTIWTLTYIFLCAAPVRQSALIQTTLFAVFITIAYVVFVAHPVLRYFSLFLDSAFNEIKHVLINRTSARHLFADYGGDPTPWWERIMSLSSAALITSSLPFGLLCLWQRYRSNALAYMFGIFSIFYPITQVLRFTSTGSEISDRTSAFLFIPISCVLAIFITHFWPIRLLKWKKTTLLTCAIAVVFIGNVVLGSGPNWAILPGGPYLASADVHSIEPEGIQAALWVRSHLGPNNRIATDRTNQFLMNSYGEQNLVNGPDVDAIFFTPGFGPKEISVLRYTKIRYLIIDLRFAYLRPRLGFYFETGEPGSYYRTIPIDQAALLKLTAIAKINRVFDSGDLIIYDVGGLVNAH